MMKAIIGLTVVVFTAGTGLSQTFRRTSQEAVTATLPDLQGLGEMFNTPKTEPLPDRRVVWPLMTYNPAFATSPSPRPATSSGPIVSVGHLRHRVPKSANKAYERASKFARANDVGRAAMELESAIALDPEFGEAHAELGVQYARLGRYREAEAEFLRTTELIPYDPLPHTNLAWVELQFRDLAAAERSLRCAIQLSPANAMASMLLGLVLLGAPETQAEGIRHLEYDARTIPDAELILNKLNGNVPVIVYRTSK